MQVEFVKIDRVTSDQYSGDVFNLQTENEEYIVGQIVVHNCPHIWDTRPEQVAREECADLWMGA
jgi:hypothetical protein